MGTKCNHKCPFRREAEGDFKQKTESHVKMEAERDLKMP